MTRAAGWSRRAAAQGLLAGVAGACAAPPRRTPVLSINLAQLQPQTEPATGTRLETAFDQALRMTVPVRLGRRGPFQFVVDTGANRTVVAQETAAACGLGADGTAAVHGIAGSQPAGLVRTPVLRVGSVSAHDLSLPVLPRAALGADGLLGVDVMKNRRVRLNFRGNSFEIGPSRQGAIVGLGGGSRIPRQELGVVVPAQYRAGQLVIFDAEVAGTPVRAFMDSGSQVTCGNAVLRELLIRRRPELAGRMAPTQLISATGQTAEARLATLPELRLGGLALYNVRAAFAPLHIFSLWKLDDVPAILVGVDVLRHFAEVILDFGQREVTFLGGRRQPRPAGGGT